MKRRDLLRMIDQVQTQKCELDDLEVKSAREGTPRRLCEPLSAFANSACGGVLLFGLDEREAYRLVGVGDPGRLQEELSGLASTAMEPPLRPRFTVATVDEKSVVAVEIAPLPASSKPCYYKKAGLHKGSYLRVGNTNRLMSDYEVFGFVSAHQQPRDDEQPVVGMTLDDLDLDRLTAHVEGFRHAHPRAAYLRKPIDHVLEQLKIVARSDDGELRPTLAGLLMFGSYPQSHEPQMFVAFLQFYGTTETEKGPRGERFIDNRKFEGPVPDMIEGAVNHVLASIRKSSLIDGLFRREIPEYPEEAVREAVVNAVAHRDYSRYAGGSHITVRLFADRLEIQSPGGLFGNVTVLNLDTEQSTRNRTLMRLMEDAHLVENRGSGINAMIASMSSANLEPPRFKDCRSSFSVTFRSHTLMNPDAIMWLNEFATMQLSDEQRLALVYLRQNKTITNSEYRRLTHVDSIAATHDLTGLARLGLARQHGAKRWTHYELAVPADIPMDAARKAPEEVLLAFVKEHGFVKRADCMELLGVGDAEARRLLTQMRKKGLLQLEGAKRGARYVIP